MKRRELLRSGALAGVVGLTGIAAYRGLSGREPEAGGPGPTTVQPGTSSVDPTRPGTQPTDSPSPTEPDPTTTNVTPPPSRQPVPHADEFGTVIDAVAAGADPGGEEPVGGFFEEWAGDDTLLSFPSGTYLLPRLTLEEYDHLGVAAADADERPTFVAPAGSCTDRGVHLQFGQVRQFLLDGVDFDFRRDGAGGAVNVIAAGDATVRNLDTVGSCRSQTAMFRIDVRDPGGTGLAENVRARHEQDTGWITGAYVGKHHSGEVTFRNCAFTEFTDNGLYASAPGTDGGGGGTVHTEDGRYENNNVSNVRLGTAGSSSTGDTIVVESAPDAETLNLRGIRFRRGAEQVVEDCEIRYGSDVTDSFGAMVFHADNGGARIADSQVTMRSDGIPAVRAFYHSGGPGGPTFENLTVDGDASRGFAMLLNGRDGTTIRNCTVTQDGATRDGIRIAYSEDCEIVGSRVDVTGYPLVLRDSTVTIRDTTFETPEGTRHVDYMEAGPGDFRPSSWESPTDDSPDRDRTTR